MNNWFFEFQTKSSFLKYWLYLEYIQVIYEDIV